MMRRNETEITIAILEVAREPAMKTEIVYKTNINFVLAKRYLDLLIGNGLIISVPNEKYLITKKGNLYLRKAKELSSLMVTRVLC